MPAVYSSATSIFSKLRTYGNNSDWAIEIDPPWEFEATALREGPSKRPVSVLLSGQITVKGCHFSKYSFVVSVIIRSLYGTHSAPLASCCEKFKKVPYDVRVLRRFHLDIHTDPSDIVEKRPICHIQYGGKAKELEAYHYCQDSWLDKPRFPSPPFDVLLLLYMILRQFQGSAKFVDRDWLALIRKSEKLIWGAYYDQVARQLNQDSKSLLYDALCDKNVTWI
jgi:hypothetical protein